MGPFVETRDSLKVLEQTDDRPIALEELALETASELLELCLTDASDKVKEDYSKKYKNPLEWATDVLKSGAAHKKMMEIVKAQGGKSSVSSKDLHGGKNRLIVKAEKGGKIKRVSSKNITLLAKLLGAPEDKNAGMILYKRLEDKVEKDEELLIFYSESAYRLKEASDSYDLFPVYEIER